MTIMFSIVVGCRARTNKLFSAELNKRSQYFLHFHVATDLTGIYLYLSYFNREVDE